MSNNPEIPESYASEKGLLGAALLAPNSIASIMGAVSAEDFYHNVPRKAYTAICDLALENKPVSVATVSRQSGLSQDEVAGLLSGGSGEEWGFWAKEVKTFARRRDLYRVGEEALRLSLSGADPEASVSRVTSMLLDGGQDLLGVSSVKDSMHSVISALEMLSVGDKSLQGIPSGWDALDKVLDGFRPGTVTLVYAPTSQFKSLFVTNLAWQLGYDGIPGLMFTTEMPTNQVLQRLLQIECQLSLKQARFFGKLPEHMQRLKEGAEILAGYPLYFSDRSTLDISYLSSLVLQAKKRRNIQYVIVDLVDHVHSRHFNEETKNESYVMQQLKDVAKRCDVAIIATGHIKKADFTQRQQRAPVIDLEEVKGASSKYQDVDVAISLSQVTWGSDSKGNFRWIQASREERLEQQKKGEAFLMVGITKNREGELASILFKVLLDQGGTLVPHVDTEGG